MNTDKPSIIGNPERRVDALGKVTGTAKFADDYSLPHQLVGKVLRSLHPHARIVSVFPASVVMRNDALPARPVVGAYASALPSGAQADGRT